ncbi:50S ribosomal protein L5 [Candidatus Nomurabacteria bacterium]|nr:50S ribosomal protein L5 [Candidatus Nomurabacteria bacterium]
MIVQDKINNVKEALGFANPMEATRLEKIVVSVGTGKRSRVDRHWNDLVQDRLAKITGQKSSVRAARQSIAGFKIRAGDPVGQMVTLRGKRMMGFLEKLIHVALPRTKDFRGIKKTAVDGMGNLTIGIKEHTIFPEATDEEISNVFGLSITLVSTASNKVEAMKFFEHIGIPFVKDEA